MTHASPKRHVQFITGRLAEAALRRVVEQLAVRHDFAFTIDVLPITVAALMTPAWIARHWKHVVEATDILLPGYCDSSLELLSAQTNTPIHVGPRDLRALPEFFGGQNAAEATTYGSYTTEIIAEINHAPQLSLDALLDAATQLKRDGADIVDLGCSPGRIWNDVAQAVRLLCDAGFRVSIDSFDPREVTAAAAAGAELVLSVNHTNREAACDWDTPVVAIPDTPDDLESLDATVQLLDKRGVPFRLDPILEPIGFGFAESLKRYAATRQRYPDTPMMMGIGNLTELTDVDSAGVNLLLLAICEEWRIDSVLTTQVINWARTSVRECDRARRLVHHAVTQRILPKHVDRSLIALRDEKLYEQGDSSLAELSQQIKDHNYRVFAERDQIHLVSANLYLSDRDPYHLLERLLATHPKNVDPSHAFYLGFEMCKAATALMLGKQYNQDQPLNWGVMVLAEEMIESTKHR